MANPVEIQGIVPVRPVVPRLYRADITVVGLAGNVVELTERLGSKTLIRVLQVFFSKPSAATTLVMRVQANLDSGGTSTLGTIVPLNSTIPSAARIKLYTGAPTLGTLLGSVFSAAIATGDVFTEDFSAEVGNGLLLKQGRPAFALNLSADATIRGYITWSEETYGE